MAPKVIYVPIPRTWEHGKGATWLCEVEDFEIGRVFWIIQVGPKYNHKAPCKREARRSQEEKVADDRSRGWRDVASSLQEPERASSGFSLGASRRNQPANTLTL